MKYPREPKYLPGFHASVLSSTSIDVVLKMMMKCTTYAKREIKTLSLLKISGLGLNSHSLASLNLQDKKQQLVVASPYPKGRLLIGWLVKPLFVKIDKIKNKNKNIFMKT